MSSLAFSRLAENFPAERKALERLERFLGSTGSRGSYTFQFLFTKASPRSVDEFTALLEALVEAEILDQEFVVESPETLEGIARFDSLEEIPSFVDDPSTGEDLAVSLDRVRVRYKPHAGVA